MAQARTFRTRARLLAAALDLFERQGFEGTTVTQIAEAAGVSQMTFFRHFPTKESVLVTDPYDPMIAHAIAAQDPDLPLIHRIQRGLALALVEIDAAESDTARRRIALLDTPSLRAAMLAGNSATEDAIVTALVDTGADPTRARIATSAAMAALGTALVAWANDTDGAGLADAITDALAVLTGAEAAAGEEPR